MEYKNKLKIELPPETLTALSKALEGYRGKMSIMSQAILESTKRLNIDVNTQFKGMADALSAAMAPFREFVELNGDYLKKLGEKHDELKVKSKETFRAVKREFIFYLAQNGYIIPDEEQFFQWYFMVKYAFAPFTIKSLEKMSIVTPADLKEYHDYKVAQFHQEEEVIELDKPKEEKLLPDFPEILIEPENLPQLWKSLSKIEKPFVSENGNLIKMKHPHAVLMAFAQTLSTKDKIKDGITVQDTYLIVCRFFNVEPASRPDKAAKTHRYKDFLSDLTDCM